MRRGSQIVAGWFSVDQTGGSHTPAAQLDFPNRLLAPEPDRRQPAAAWGIVACLLLFTGIPRAWMADCVEVICSDGTCYVQLAEALERGDLQQAFRLQFNIYPLALAALHQTGLSWERAGNVWGILMATLAVLPLWGWLRRMYDDRIALVACGLYAIHPELIEWSPEVIREPTFWFTFSLTLYTLWRGVIEVRRRWFAAAAIAGSLSVLTRFEGLFLLVPLVGWTLVRYRALASSADRRRLLAAATLSPLVLPLFLIVVNQFWLHQGSPTDLLRLEQLNRVREWLASFRAGVEHGPMVKVDPSVPPQSLLARWGSSTWAFFHTLERGLTPFHVLLLVVGLIPRRRWLVRSDFLPLVIVTLLVFGGIWVHLWYTGLSSSRYSMVVALLTMPLAALGLLQIGEWIERWLSRSRALQPAARWATISCFLVLATIGWVDALSSEFHSRKLSARLGTWIRAAFGSERVILGIDEQLAIISFHASGHYWKPPEGVRGQPLVDLIREQTPDLIIITRAECRARDFDALLKQQRQLGFQTVDAQLLPDNPGRVIVLSRVPMLR